MVRLSKGDYISEGLVEVYCNGEWGTICDDGIDDDEADTICVQLGYTKASSWDNLKLYVCKIHMYIILYYIYLAMEIHLNLFGLIICFVVTLTRHV